MKVGLWRCVSGFLVSVCALLREAVVGRKHTLQYPKETGCWVGSLQALHRRKGPGTVLALLLQGWW